MAGLIVINAICVVIAAVLVVGVCKNKALQSRFLVAAAFFMLAPLFALIGLLTSSFSLAFKGALFAVFGGIFVIWLSGVIEAKKCTVPVTAKCTEITVQSSKGREFYTPVFQWEYDGDRYEGSGTRTFSKRIKKHLSEGEMCTIHINPERPERCEYKELFPTNELIGGLFISLFFAGSFLLLVWG